MSLFYYAVHFEMPFDERPENPHDPFSDAKEFNSITSRNLRQKIRRLTGRRGGALSEFPGICAKVFEFVQFTFEQALKVQEGHLTSDQLDKVMERKCFEELPRREDFSRQE